MKMYYIKVHWKHDMPDEPELLYSEVDSEGGEVRKVEVFKDGSMGYASGEVACRSKLAECKMPTIEEISEDPQFVPIIIEQSEFDEIWNSSQSG